MMLSDLKLADRERHLRYAGFFKECPAPQYSIVWEDGLDGTCNVTSPSPQWLKMAMHGGVIPPVETYMRDKDVPDGDAKEHPYATPVGPMTEEQAMEYLLQKDVPMHVWSETSGNSRKFLICPRALVPTDRSYRNAWQLNQEAA